MEIQTIKYIKKNSRLTIKINGNNKQKSCNNRVKLLIIPTYSITNSKVNSTLTITIQQIIQLLWHYNNKIYSKNSKKNRL
jgi:hypothetical protein